MAQRYISNTNERSEVEEIKEIPVVGVKEEEKSAEPKDQAEDQEKQDAAENEPETKEIEKPIKMRGFPCFYKALKLMFGPKQREADRVVYVQSSEIKVEEPEPPCEPVPPEPTRVEQPRPVLPAPLNIEKNGFSESKTNKAADESERTPINFQGVTPESVLESSMSISDINIDSLGLRSSHMSSRRSSHGSSRRMLRGASFSHKKRTDMMSSNINDTTPCQSELNEDDDSLSEISEGPKQEDDEINSFDAATNYNKLTRENYVNQQPRLTGGGLAKPSLSALGFDKPSNSPLGFVHPCGSPLGFNVTGGSQYVASVHDFSV